MAVVVGTLYSNAPLTPIRPWRRGPRIESDATGTRRLTRDQADYTDRRARATRPELWPVFQHVPEDFPLLPARARFDGLTALWGVPDGAW